MLLPGMVLEHHIVQASMVYVPGFGNGSDQGFCVRGTRTGSGHRDCIGCIAWASCFWSTSFGAPALWRRRC